MNDQQTQEHTFRRRHIGPSAEETREMLRTVGVSSLDQLIEETIPPTIRRAAPLSLGEPLSEQGFLGHLQAVAAENSVLRSFIGEGFYGTIVPPAIRRGILENPGWYTQYTPYQPEISQGRLEALLNFQTMVADLTGMEIANASLLDEGTAVAEAAAMAHGIVAKGKDGDSRTTVRASSRLFGHSLDVLRTRMEPLGLTVSVEETETIRPDASTFAVILQYPAEDGRIEDIRGMIDAVHAAGGLAIVATDLLACTLLTPPGEMGADIVVGNAQRFGVPMGFGGPHAAFFATRSSYIRNMPGRIIGVSIDGRQEKAYRMTLQTREQHIRREKATSNICTAQALLAIMSGMYGVYHGPEGLQAIARRVHDQTRRLAEAVTGLGLVLTHDRYFDTLTIDCNSAKTASDIVARACADGYNLRHRTETTVSVAFDETTTEEDVGRVVEAIAAALGKTRAAEKNGTKKDSVISGPFIRSSAFMQHPVFHQYRSESELMRYMKRLENKDLSLAHSMIPLGSCTMKLNAAVELLPVTWPAFSELHPFVPQDQARGYLRMFRDLERSLCEITGFAACSLQPNSGAQGEYSGLLVIRACHLDRGEAKRNVMLIPSSAHGTNPASAVMAGMKVVVVRCDDRGNIDLGDLQAKAEQYAGTLAGLMVTYPSTHGVFEEEIRKICSTVHAHGGLVYMDGANMNAQVGLTSPAIIGADVCHLNLHKTFAIPHGGGGPGMGPICVTEALAPYLPGHGRLRVGDEKAAGAVASAPYGSASILVISYAYIRMLAGEGLTDATRWAILNANYLKARLGAAYPVLYEGKNGRVGHEFILSMRSFKDTADIEVEDIAKRLMDYGFHAPTVSFPVAGTLMIEPTESESKAELDRFADAMLSIRQEIQEIADGTADRTDNVLKHAPHPAQTVTSDEWTHPYTRAKAAYPLPFVRERKFWPSVGRINNTYGDRNIMCSCPPLDAYAEEVAANANRAE